MVRSKVNVSFLNLGVHVSIAGKIYNAVDRAKRLHCSTMQIFARSPRQWRRTSLAEEDIKIFRQRVISSKIKPVVVHIPYLLNLASHKHSFYEISIREFIQDLTEADQLGVQYLVTHPGSYKGSSEAQGLIRVAKALKKILQETEGVKTKILLENTSGSGSWLGHSFSQLRTILEGIDFSRRVGVCLDTAHAWGAGYELNTPEGLAGLLAEVDREVGLGRLRVVHLNDTQVACASRLDRHFAIGKGRIGKQGFGLVVNHPALARCAFILETPRLSPRDDLRNLRVIRKLHKDGVQ